MTLMEVGGGAMVTFWNTWMEWEVILAYSHQRYKVSIY